MSAVIDVLSWAMLVAGALFCVIGAIGLNRMPDLFSRLHAVSVIETLGVGFLIIGMLLQTDDWTVAVRLVIIAIILLATAPVATHALARAALFDGRKPLLAGAEGRLEETDCREAFPDLAQVLEQPLEPSDAAPGEGEADRSPS